MFKSHILCDVNYMAFWKRAVIEAIQVTQRYRELLRKQNPEVFWGSDILDDIAILNTCQDAPAQNIKLLLSTVNTSDLSISASSLTNLPLRHSGADCWQWIREALVLCTASVNLKLLRKIKCMLKMSGIQQLALLEVCRGMSGNRALLFQASLMSDSISLMSLALCRFTGEAVLSLVVRKQQR